MAIEKGFTPASEITARIEGLQQRLAAEDIAAALIMQNTDLFYYSGTAQQAYLYVPAAGEPVLLVKKDLERARAESALADIRPLKSIRQIPAAIGASPGRLGLELDVISANIYLDLAALFEKSELVDVSPLIRLQRAVKSAHELGIIRAAADLSDRLAAFVPSVLTAGMTELEFNAAVEAEARRLGHQGMMRMRLWGAELFYGHLMSGASAAVPSYLASPTGGPGTSPAFPQGVGYGRVQAGQPVLVDMAFAFQGYISDHTRIFAIDHIDDDLVEAQEAMLAVQGLIQEAGRPGAVTGDLYQMAVDKAADLGYADNFMGAGENRIRFVGHGVGLELDEFPFLAKGQTLALEENMVVALEPKLIFPGRGVVGIENTHQVTPDGMWPLGRYPETITIF
ncbi:MAG: Xaa-Pro peptidase family protein [Desulfosudaceae bacterium]